MGTLESQVKDYARELGFDLVGIASPEGFSDHEAVTLERIDAGLMDGLPWYTEARVRRGCDTEGLLPGARSIIAVGMSYHLPDRDTTSAVPAGKVWPAIAGATTITRS